MHKRFVFLTLAFTMTTILLGSLFFLPVSAAPNGGTVTAVYILAFDNNPASSVNLAKQYTTTINSIAAATTITRQAVILADLSGSADTHILIASNQTLTPIAGLPDSTGALDLQLQEYNTASGTDLGGFLLWALNTYPATTTVVSYVGHGAPLVPETNIAAAFDLDGTGIIPDPNVDDLFLPPLPIHVDVNDGLTDDTSQDMISPYDLATMLKPANDAGLPPINVLDLVHCFSGTIEELYEIAQVRDGTGGSFVNTMIASPNYTFFAPTMLGAALNKLEGGTTSAATATSLIHAYDQHLLTFDQTDDNADINHPRFIVGIDSGNLLLVKEAWDTVAYYLLQDFPANKPHLAAAYFSDTVDKYDTTFCAPLDYQLTVPDALVDMTRLARELSIQYTAVDPIATWSVETIRRLNDAVITSTFRSGQPWFATEPKPEWNFDEAMGIALYADFAGMTLLPDTSPALLWQSHWYTDTVFGGETGNLHPYAFVQGGYDGVSWQPTGSGANWADVFAAWWQDELGDSGDLLATGACLPTFPPLLRGVIRLPIITTPTRH